MNARFALSLPHADTGSLGAVSLGTLRRWPGLEVLETADSVWVRSPHLDDEQWEYCRRLPGADRFTLTDDGRLLAVGMLVPHGRLPAGLWRPITDWLGVELPTSDSAPPPPKPSGLALVRSTIERDAAWLLTTLDAWSAYTAIAPQVRLACWSFAANSTGLVLVRGTPLPPLPGTRFVEMEGIAVPLGFAWSPAMPAAVLRRVFKLEKDDAVLWTADGMRRRIAAGDWVRATRSAVRLTHDELARRRLASDDPVGGAAP
jgi:hypothetical protein